MEGPSRLHRIRSDLIAVFVRREHKNRTDRVLSLSHGASVVLTLCTTVVLTLCTTMVLTLCTTVGMRAD
jgi:hypothetical protein